MKKLLFSAILMILAASGLNAALAQKPVWQQTDPNADYYLDNRRALTGRHCMVNKLVNAVGVATWIKDLNNLVDEDLNNYATFPKIVDATVGVNPITAIRDTENYYAAGTTAGFTLVAGSNSSLLGLDIVKAFAISFYKDGELISTVPVEAGQTIGGVGLSLITIPGSTDVNLDFSATAPAEFDEIALMPSGGVDLTAITNTKIKYAFVGDYTTNTITEKSMQQYAASHGRLPFSLDQGKRQREGKEGLDLATETGYWAGSDLINDDLTDGVAWGVLSIGTALDVRIGAAPNRQDPDQSMPFKKGSTVGFMYGNGSILKLPVGKSVVIELYKGEWVEKEGGTWPNKYTYYEYQQTEVQSETVNANVLSLSLISGGSQQATITAKEDFSHARITFPTGLTIDVGGTKVYYGFVSDPAEAVHHCDLKLTANTEICDSETSYQLTSEGGQPVAWSITSQPGSAVISEQGLLTGMNVPGDYVVRATAQDGCYDETTITRGLTPVETICDVPAVNRDPENPDYVLSDKVNVNGSLISIDGELQYPENVLSKTLEDYATVRNALALDVVEDRALVGIKKADGSNFSDGNKHRIGFVVEMRSSGLTLEALELFHIATYKNGVETYNSVTAENNAVKLKLIGSSKVQKMNLAINVPADVEFDEFVLLKTGVLKLDIDRMNIFYAFDEVIPADQEQSPCNDPMGCDATLVSPNTGATLNNSELQMAGAINVANVVNNLSFLVDDDVNTGVSITNTVSLGTGTVLAVDLGHVYDAHHQVGIIVDNKTYLAGIKAGSWLTIKTYLNGVATGDEQSDWSVLGVNAIGYGDKSFLFMNPTKPYDEIRITIAGIASVLNVDQKYYGIFVRSDYDRDGIPDCRDNDSCADEYTLDEEATELNKGRDFPNGNLALHRSFNLGDWNCIVLPVNLTWLQLRNAFGNDVKVSTPTQLIEGSGKNVLSYNVITTDDGSDVITAGDYFLIKPFREPDVPAGQIYVALDGTELNGPVYFIPGVTYLQETAEAPVPERQIKSSRAAAPSLLKDASGKADVNEHMVVLHGSNVMLDGNVNNNVPAGNYMFNEDGELWAISNDDLMLGFRYYIENRTDKVLTYDGDGDGTVTAIDIVNAYDSIVNRGTYTLDGRFLGNDVDKATLPAGIYIINGHKVVVR